MPAAAQTGLTTGDPNLTEHEDSQELSPELPEVVDVSPTEEATAQLPPPERGFGRLLWKEWVRPFILILAVMGTFRSAVADWNHVPTGSMKPTILVGDRIFVNKLAYDLKVPFTRKRVASWGRPQRGDLVVFFSPADGKRLVKRVVGLPGDEVSMDDNQLVVNGVEIGYSALGEEAMAGLAEEDQRLHDFQLEHLGERSHPVMLAPQRPSRRSFDELTVPEDDYFVMGDNRDESFDSRWFGVVDRELIVGRATAIAISVDPDRFYLPRWGRFFSDLP